MVIMGEHTLYLMGDRLLRAGDFVYADEVCTVDQFTQRAKELGFINGYRWGIEYQTNGKRPDLADDVVISIKPNWSEIYIGDTYVRGCNWVGIVHFKITDQRHKPQDTSYLQTPAV